ncbi:zinc finger protein 585B-like [Zerene cesonia]|uniref:zinc finger protein 585B-like n=1 Tax=Zerene cesonia TaxID=33412 RepID=UPI0018E4F448|nr:zinc finger protein 585B-like [Zerene cesonia]
MLWDNNIKLPLKRKEHLDRHMQGHMELRPHICDDCGKGFKRKEHLNIHKSIHKGEKALQCSICSKRFYRKDHLQKHIQTHNKHFMEQNIIPMSDQELSIKQEVEDDNMPIITDVSGNVTDNDVSMESEDYSNTEILGLPLDHQLTVDHAKCARPFVCVICGKSYKRKDHLKIHSWTHMKKEVVCTQCGKDFHTEDQMLVHVNLVHLKIHETGTIVNNGLTQLKSLLGEDIEVEVLQNNPRAPTSKRDTEGRKHECPICHRKFKRKQHLKVHAKVHLKKKRTFYCGICHEGFNDNNQFENHKCRPNDLFRNPEQDKDDNEYEQNGEYEPDEEHGESEQHNESGGGESERGESERGEYEHEDGEYEQHTIFGHNGTSPNGDARKENYPQDLLEVVVEEAALPTPQRVFVCKFCGKPFRRKDHYKIHLHIHTGLKSFFCPTCGKGFYRKDHLQKHMIVHARSHMKKAKQGRALPALLPLAATPLSRKEVKPEITIHAPCNAKIRVPLQMKVPYQMVMSLDNGETRAVTVDPTAHLLGLP